MFVLYSTAIRSPPSKYLVVLLGVCILLQAQSVKSEESVLADNDQKSTGEVIQNSNGTAKLENNSLFDELDDEAKHSIRFDSILIDIFDQTRQVPEESDASPNRFNESKAVIFLGKAGCGKSTLVQFITSNVTRLQAKEKTEDSGDYYIDNGFRINNGIDSDYSLTKVVKDNETGIFLTDSPGFLDSEGLARDLNVALNMKNVTESFGKVKITLVATQMSLHKGNYRSEFTGFLERISDFLGDSEQFYSGISLIATKVKTKYLFRKGNIIMVSDETEVETIANFLQDVKHSYSSGSSALLNTDRSRKIVKILKKLLEKKSHSYDRIKIFRMPQHTGPLTNQNIMMVEREAIRKMLFNDEGFGNINRGELGVTISAATRDSINNIFRQLDNYVVACTEKFGRFLQENFLRSIKTDEDNIENLIKRRKKDLDVINYLESQIGECQSPEDYVNVIGSFIKSQNLTYQTTFLESISKQSRILLNVENLRSKNYSTSKNWQGALMIAKKTIQDEFLYQSMLQETFLRLRDYRIQRKNVTFLGDENSTDEESSINPAHILTELNLQQYIDLEFNNERREEFNNLFMKLYSRNDKRIICERKNLIIINKLIFLSDINNEIMNCYYVDSVIALAADTVIIDIDLKQQLEGRNLMIIAPRWLVQGERLIAVDGKPFFEKPVKASFGEVGLDGRDGNPSGNFLGVGLNFQGMEGLTVQACGGNGEDGQDGGDGMDGQDGADEAVVNVGRQSLFEIPFIYNKDSTVIRKEGSLGSAGQDSGAGGRGGLGGAKGSVQIINLSSNVSSNSGAQHLGFMSNECEGQRGLSGADGKPGKSGSNGCSTIESITDHELFGRGIYSTKESEILPCEKITPKGEVLRERRLNTYIPKKMSPLPKVCSMINKLFMFIENKNYNSKLTMRSINEFQSAVDGNLCT